MAMYKLCMYCRSRYPYKEQCECDGAKRVRQRQQKQYDKYVRRAKDNVKYDKFYHSKEWLNMVKFMKNKYNNLCIMCLVEKQEPVKCEQVHHIVEIKTDEGWEQKLNEELLIPLCHDCHNKQHANYSESKINQLIALKSEYKEKYEV